jgi:hypothetical protein
MLCYAMLCYAMLCYAMPCHAMPCYAVLCCAMLCCAMLCCAMLCYAMLCYARPQNICRALVVNAVFSTFSYLVNLLLAEPVAHARMPAAREAPQRTRGDEHTGCHRHMARSARCRAIHMLCRAPQASRFLALNLAATVFLSAAALAIYCSCLALNWAWQAAQYAMLCYAICCAIAARSRV